MIITNNFIVIPDYKEFYIINQNFKDVFGLNVYEFNINNDMCIFIPLNQFDEVLKQQIIKSFQTRDIDINHLEKCLNIA